MKSICEQDLVDHMNVADLIILFRRHPGFFSPQTRNWLSELSLKVDVLKVIHPQLSQESSIHEVITQTESEITEEIVSIH